jgi:hypothetical protein
MLNRTARPDELVGTDYRGRRGTLGSTHDRSPYRLGDPTRVETTRKRPSPVTRWETGQ